MHVGVAGPQLAAREAAAVVHEVGEVLSLEAERAVVRVVGPGLGTEGRASDDWCAQCAGLTLPRTPALGRKLPV